MLQEMTLIQGRGYARLMNCGSENMGIALRKYRDARLQGRAQQMLSRLLGRPRSLKHLDALRSEGRLHGGHDAGLQTIPIRLIRGSEGRSQDFDQAFHPLSAHTQRRWVSLAEARECGVVLPPVDLIQVGEEYFVRDGHHRISVARAFGQEEIEAQVTVLEMA